MLYKTSKVDGINIGGNHKAGDHEWHMGEQQPKTFQDRTKSPSPEPGPASGGAGAGEGAGEGEAASSESVQ